MMKNQSLVAKNTACRACKKSDFISLFSFGMTPLANAFLKKEQLDEQELYFPLDVYQCRNCGLVQLGHVVHPSVLFGNYVYVSSTSKVFIHHFVEYAKDIVSRFHLSKESLAVDIGSNDGILLKPFKELGVRVLGVEPATAIAIQARKDGISTEPEFFKVTLARKIVKRKGKASVVTANNVLAHIHNLDEVISGINILLHKDGVFVIEAPYLVDFLQKNYFDLVYHEHLSYLSIQPLQQLFSRFSMEIFDIQKQPVHGGSIRVFVKNKEGRHPIRSSVAAYLRKERALALYEPKTWQVFAKKILNNKALLVRLLTALKLKGKTIAAYGAPAKGNTLLNYFGIGKEIIDFVVDDSPWKQGLYTPGTHIPVVSSEVLYQKKPDYLLILAWNFASSIIDNNKKYSDAGGKFIIPVSRPHVVQIL